MSNFDIYKSRVSTFVEKATEKERIYNRYSILRLIVFIAAVGASVLLFSSMGWWAMLFVLVFVGLFGLFVTWHQKFLTEKNHFQRLVAVNEDELKIIDDEMASFESGREFLDTTHPYSVDLDIFGDYSLFHYLNRTSTSIGKVEFAENLAAPVTRDLIVARQNAIQELSEKLDWRQHFQAYGRASSDELKNIENLNSWIDDENIMHNNKSFKAALYWVPVIVIAAMITPLTYLPLSAKIFFFLIPAYFLKKTIKDINAIHERTGKAVKILKNYGRLIGHIEGEDFNSEKLVQLRSLFITDGTRASSVLGKLSKIIGQLNVRYNPFALVLNLFFLWDMIYVLKLEKWKVENRENLRSWFEGLRKFDSLLSFGTLKFNRPHWIFPEIVTGSEFVYSGSGIGHPLLPEKNRILNDLNFSDNSNIKLITGSNMAGKSTFLRSIGLSIVMGGIGAPVCAENLKMSISRVYSSMRTKDDLHESTSSFYAELKRLRFILEAVKKGEPVFFLLDEILKGTNSMDRHMGAKALVLQLIRLNGNGLVATHDLELGELAKEYPEQLENLCFEVEVDGEELKFDYKVRMGIAQSLNATILMRKMGIEI